MLSRAPGVQNEAVCGPETVQEAHFGQNGRQGGHSSSSTGGGGGRRLSSGGPAFLTLARAGTDRYSLLFSQRRCAARPLRISYQTERVYRVVSPSGQREYCEKSFTAQSLQVSYTAIDISEGPKKIFLIDDYVRALPTGSSKVTETG